MLCAVLGAAKPNPTKEVYLPKSISTVPKDNDFGNNNSEYSNKRSEESINFKIYWAKEYGDNPLANVVSERRFDIKKAVKELERYYDYYVNKLKIVKRGKSVSDKYKILFFITGGKNSTAYGGGDDDEKVGILWSPAVRLNKEPYGVLAHELGHVFQFLAKCDNNQIGFNGPISEMGAQFMLWQVYPDWLTFENFHLKAFLNNTYHAFLHPENSYHSPFMIEYWAEKHGDKFYGKLLREVKRGEDPVQTYQRITNINQDEFNKQIFDASGKFITWDIPRIEGIANKYANQHYTKLHATGNGWLQIDKSNCPEDYGYNAIKLKVPINQNIVTLQFHGLTDSITNFRNELGRAGWRYGFIAYKKNGHRIYGNMGKDNSGNLTFKVPVNTQYLWLLVTGAPNSHISIKGKKANFEQWPYEIKLTGTEVY